MKKQFRVDGVDCANCAAKIERGVQGLDGVQSASLNFMTTKLVIEADETKMADIIKEAEKIVAKVEPGATMRKA